MRKRDFERKIRDAVQQIFWDYCRDTDDKKVLENIKEATRIIQLTAVDELQLSEKAKLEEYLV